MYNASMGAAKAHSSDVSPCPDPIIPNWQSLQLPETWPDALNFKRPLDILKFLRHVFGKRQALQIPQDLPGRDIIPKYALQEFHRLPNGNFSHSVTQGYIRGFEYAMLKRMDHGRNILATQLQHCKQVLDVGCASGRTASIIKQAGVEEVWGLDISPYLLQHAAKTYPEIHFVHGKAEATGFAKQRFDGISACYLFHEIPPKYIHAALDEFNRILTVDGTLAIMEPYATQLTEKNPLKLFRYDGLASFYFKALAKFVHEPFIDHWHKQDVAQLLAQHGFTLIDDQTQPPSRIMLAKKTRDIAKSI